MAIAAHPLWAGEGGRDPKTPEVYRGLVAKELAELRAGRGGPLRVEAVEATEATEG